MRELSEFQGQHNHTLNKVTAPALKLFEYAYYVHSSFYLNKWNKGSFTSLYHTNIPYWSMMNLQKLEKGWKLEHPPRRWAWPNPELVFIIHVFIPTCMSNIVHWVTVPHDYIFTLERENKAFILINHAIILPSMHRCKKIFLPVRKVLTFPLNFTLCCSLIFYCLDHCAVLFFKNIKKK